MKYLIVYGASTDTGQIIGNIEVTIPHRKISSDNILDVKDSLVKQGLSNITIINIIRLKR